LGIVTEATLRLLPPPPPARGTLVAAFADLPTLGRAIGALAGHPARPTSLEMVDRHCLAVVDDYRPPEIPAGAAGVLVREVLDRPERLARPARRACSYAKCWTGPKGWRAACGSWSKCAGLRVRPWRWGSPASRPSAASGPCGRPCRRPWPASSPPRFPRTPPCPSPRSPDF